MFVCLHLYICKYIYSSIHKHTYTRSIHSHIYIHFRTHIQVHLQHSHIWYHSSIFLSICNHTHAIPVQNRQIRVPNRRSSVLQNLYFFLFWHRLNWDGYRSRRDLRHVPFLLCTIFKFILHFFAGGNWNGQIRGWDLGHVPICRRARIWK